MEINAVVENNTVTDARTAGLLFRGFEKMLVGRSPFDVVYFTERICGICSAAHSLAAALALEEALDITVSEQGRFLRDITHGCEFLQNHIRHFYQFTVPDFVRFPAGNPLFETDHHDFRLPKEENERIVQHYFDSLAVSRAAHEMLAVLGGKAPHNHGIFIGGITTEATIQKIDRLRQLLFIISQFINDKMVPDAAIISEHYRDYFKMGRGYGNFLSYGCFNHYEQLGTLYVDPLVGRDGKIERFDPEEITENVHSSWYKAKAETYTPYETIADPDLKKDGAYSWVKAARYKGLPYEVGPLARMWLSGDYRAGISAMDRTIARVLEAKKIAGIISILLDQLIPGVITQEQYTIPNRAYGKGLVDTTRGALGHWLKIENGLISFYQIITPSVWNLSTRGEDQLPGPVEQALIGTKMHDDDHPVTLGRIVRTFDPCVSCATHVHTEGKADETVVVVP